MIQLIKRKYAFSLLEIMLALSVVAIVTILAVRYYSSSAQSQRIQNAVDQINAVRGAMQNAVVGSNVNLGYVPQIGQLVTLGFLPPSTIGASSMSAAAGITSGINPWGGSIYVQHNPGLLFKVVMVVPNIEICNVIKVKLESTAASPQSVNCRDSSGGDGGTDTTSSATVTAQYTF